MDTDPCRFAPTRSAALAALDRFVPHAGRAYAARRNYDLGPDKHSGVSQLSPYLRHRLLTETEVLDALLAQHAPKSAEKFVQEVYWRTYWKGWMEMRPSVWRSYQAEVSQAIHDVMTQGGLRRGWESACEGDTGLTCFDAWAHELVTTGYLHNHARMWFASIWIFTLRLPWVLGADFFLRHLLDGDPAVNTLSWRWVAGLQTPGRTYLARPGNIAKYTEGRFSPTDRDLAPLARALTAPPLPPPVAPPTTGHVDLDKHNLLILHEEDLSPDWLFQMGLAPVGTWIVPASNALSPLRMAEHVTRFRDAAIEDAHSRWQGRMGTVRRGPLTPETLVGFAKSLSAEQIVTSHAPVGPVADDIATIKELPVQRVVNPHDQEAWPYAGGSFSKFKTKIPKLLAKRRGLQLALPL